jgi:glycerol uptake facilitator-like aquaporin
MVIATGWALAVMTGVFTAIACGSPGAHLNPAVTLGFAVKLRRFQQVCPAGPLPQVLFESWPRIDYRRRG